MIQLYLRNYFKAGERRLTDAKELGFFFLFLIFALLYGPGFGWFLKHSWSEGDFETYNSLFSGLLTALLVFPVLNLFFPQYVTYRDSFSPYHPVAAWKKYFLDVFKTFFRQMNLLLLIFVSLLGLFLEQDQTYWFYAALSALMMGSCFRLLLAKMLVKKANAKGRWLFLLQSLLMLLAIVAIWLRWDSIFLVSGASLLLFFGGIISPLLKGAKAMALPEAFGGNKVMKLYLGKKVRMAFIVAIIFKTIYLIGCVFVQSKGKEVVNLDPQGPLFWWFTSPLLFYTYLYLNFWGYWPGLYWNMEVRNGSLKEILKLQWSIMKWPVIADLILSTTVILLFFRSEALTFLFVSVCGLLFYTALAFAGSIDKARKLKGGLNLNKSASQTLVFGIMFGSALFFPVRFSLWFLIPAHLVVGLGLWYFFRVMKQYPTKKYQLVQQIAKPEC
ncbi:hypothetical protein [Persicobacter sp. CCB-QB2]|uniref:hypothetical protein n=1 Tax=Persicobacter sp. CCB-QB2 TaxID=1561025 RepID=UPI0012FB35BD|nr:hypothetical protein [Persicobacter sp. CCB-QB2]